MAADILKIQRAIRKAVTDYSIEGKREKEALIALISVDMYLALEEKEVVKPKIKSPSIPKDTGAKLIL